MATMLDQSWSKRLGDATLWPPFTGLTIVQRRQVSAGTGSTFDKSSPMVQQLVLQAEANMQRYPQPVDAYTALVFPHLDEIAAADKPEIERLNKLEETQAVLEAYQPPPDDAA